MPLRFQNTPLRRMPLRWVAALLLVGVMGWGEAQAWNPQVISGRCKQSGSTCSGTIGNAGQSRGSCCDPASGTQATLACEQSNTCTGGRPYKWADSDVPVKWWYNPNSMPGQAGYSGLTDAAIEGYLKQSWDAWAVPTCTSFRHAYRGKSTSFLSAQDNQTTMFLATASQWAQMGAGPSTLAFTRPVPDNSGRMLDADIAFNPQPGGRGWSASLFVATAAHEVGHAIGFAHTGDPAALMYFAASGGKQGLSSDETTAVCFTYPKKGPCSKDEDCGGCLKCVSGACVDKNITPVNNLCKPCQGPNDCGGSADICIRLEEGQRCAQACDAQGCCPNGYRCSEIGLGQKMCIPDAGSCPPAACTADTDCGPGETCQSSVCKPKPIPENPKNCKACSTNGDCGADSQCLRFDGSNRCLPNCVADNFCPTGYKCSDTGAGRVCIPENSFCPCKAATDCLTGEACRSGVCRPADCKYGCPCEEDAHCSPSHRCLQTQQGGGCFQPCGGSAGYPDGSPGSQCNGQSCDAGAQCFQIGRGQTICMKPCSSAADCSATGGQCFNLGQQSFCLCQDDSQCKNGQGCNKAILGQFGGGACAAQSAASACDTGLKCTDAGGISICQPDGTGTGDKDVGDECPSPGSCKAGLQCLQLEANGKAHCFEECTGGKACSKGGQCILGAQGSETRYCGCAPQAACSAGQTCKAVGPNGIGVCIGGTKPVEDCGNGTCELQKGETCSTCAKDCACATGTTCVANKCESDKPPPSCGNGRCDTSGESCANCPQDCACGDGKECQSGSCVDKPKDNCGDGTCDGTSGENCSTCARDCACATGQTCQGTSCQGTATKDGGNSGNDNDTGDALPCPVEDQFIGADGKPACPEPSTGCSGCSTHDPSNGVPASLLFLSFFGFLLILRRLRLR